MGKTDTLAGSASSRDEKDVTENRRTARILYVEDNYQNMRLVRKILNHAGYEMLEAEDGLTALEVVASASLRSSAVRFRQTISSKPLTG